MVNERQDSIVWALNFAFNKDLSRARKPGRYALYEELKECLFSTTQYKPALTDKLLAPGGLEEIQGALSSFFQENLFPILDGIRGLASEKVHWLSQRLVEEGMAMDHEQGVEIIRSDFPWLWEVYAKVDSVKRLPDAPRYGRHLAAVGGELRIQVDPDQEIPLADEAVERVIAIFSIDPPLPLTTFLLCKECQQFFHNRRFKWYCTPTCNRRFYARKYRGKPGSQRNEAYLDRQAEHMWHKYRKDQGLPPARYPGRKARRSKSRIHQQN